MSAALRELPSTDRLLRTRAAAAMVSAYGRALTVSALRATLGEVRANARQGGDRAVPTPEKLLELTRDKLGAWTDPTLKPVINATGVILHTNLGRAPLSVNAARAMVDAAQQYSTLEYDLVRGQRGSRLEHAESLLARLAGAESAVVVNNNAAAVLLILAALAGRRSVVVSRTQLVEIGGGFRIPDVMRQSGAKIVEIGTTNRTHLEDFRAALAEHPALVLVAHRSNFQIVGFTAEPELAEIGRLCEAHGVPLVHDLGSGAMLDTGKYGLAHEPTVQESLRAGASLTAFSGDKLLGGPQAGIIVGKAVHVTKLKRHPLFRALRADKLCLAALSATLMHYLKDETVDQVPVWRMIAMRTPKIKRRAEAWRHTLQTGRVLQSQSTVGGGSLPGDSLPTYVLALSHRSPDMLMRSLRAQRPPVIARTKDDLVLIDPRTVLEEQDDDLLAAVKRALREANP